MSIKLSYAHCVAVIFALVAGISEGLAQTVADTPGPRRYKEKLSPCVVPGVKDTVYCGFLTVFENRTTRQRSIDIAVKILPAISKDTVLSPLFHFEGGPGGASSASIYYYQHFPILRKYRDVVMVDLRGTGNSHPLHCENIQVKKRPQDYFEEMFPAEKVRNCYDSLSELAELSQYTTAIAVDDVEEIRAWLGYDKINLTGTSYGTRVCQSYMRQYPASIRSVVMFGPAPAKMTLPLSLAADAQRCIEKVFDDCLQDSLCNTTYPDVKQEFLELLQNLERRPATYVYTDKGGLPATLSIARGVFAELIRSTLYTVGGQRRIPFLIHEAWRGNFGPLVDIALRRGASSYINAFGFYLCVTCTEDVLFIDRTRMSQHVENTFLDDYRLFQQIRACENWEVGELTPDLLRSPYTSIPTLIVSGTHDPITPPRWGERMTEGLNHVSHIVVSGMAHSEYGMTNPECISNGFADFVMNLPRKFTLPCTTQMKPPAFFVEPTGK